MENELRLPWSIIEGLLCNADGDGVFGRNVSAGYHECALRWIAASANHCKGIGIDLLLKTDARQGSSFIAVIDTLTAENTRLVRHDVILTERLKRQRGFIENRDAEIAKLRELIELAYNWIDGDDEIEESTLKIMLQHPPDTAALAEKGGE